MCRLLSVAVSLCLIFCLGLSNASAQSLQDANRLFQEALEMQKSQRSGRDLELSVGKYEQALLLYRKLKDRQREGMALSNAAMIYADLGRYDKAIENYGNSLVIRKELNDRKGEAMLLNRLGTVYGRRAQYREAWECLEKSLAIKKELKDREGESLVLNNMGLVHYGWGQYDKAIEYYEKCLLMKRELKDRGGEREILNNLGNAFKARGQYAMAVDYYEKSLAINMELKDRLGESATLNNMGLVSMALGQYDKAMERYQKSLTIKREFRDRLGESNTLNNMGMLQAVFGQYGNALDYYRDSLAINRELKNRRGEGWSLLHIGEVQHYRAEFSQAFENFAQGLSILESINVSTRNPKNLLGMLYLDVGDNDRAEQLIKQVGNSASLGRLSLVNKDYRGARESYEKLLNSAEKNRNVDNLFVAHTGLGVVYENMGEEERAATHYQKAVDLMEEVRATLSFGERETFFDVRRAGFHRLEPGKGLARVLTRMNQPIEALKQSEYGRARVFAESLSRRTTGLSLKVPGDVTEKDSELNNEVTAVTKNLQTAYEKGNKLAIETLEPQVDEIKAKLATHVDMLRKQYPLFAATRYPQPMDLNQTALKDSEWVLAYDLSDSGVIIFLTKGKQLKKALFRPVPQKEIDELVRRFRKPLEMPEGRIKRDQLADFDFETGKQLSEILLADVLPNLPKDSPVIIIPDGSLGVLPFEMLVLNDAGKVAVEKATQTMVRAEFFRDRNPLSYYQSLTALTLARTLGKQKGGGQKVLVMDDPVFGPDDPRAKQAAQSKKQTTLAALPDKLMSIKKETGLTFPRLPLTGELGQSLKKVDPNQTDEFAGLKASKEVLFEKPLNQYASMIFATHGYFGNDLPGIQEPVLVLTLVDQPQGKDGFLRLTEVMGLNLNADIVALTACQTGLGRQISGEGTMGMGRAFQYAGAKSVLMSLWSVSEASSVKLVESFFKHLKDGKNKLEALRLARQEIRKAGFDHPFYWAPFILVGEVN